MRPLLTPFRASPQRLIEDFTGAKPWTKAWKTFAVWQRTRGEADAWEKEVQDRASKGETHAAGDLVDLRLPVVEREDTPDSTRIDADDPEVSAVWGAIHGHVYKRPVDVFEDWEPLALVCESIVVVDKYAVSLEGPREGDEKYAQRGLRKFTKFLDKIARDPRRQAPPAFNVRFVTSKQILDETIRDARRQRADASDVATNRLLGWKANCAPAVDIKADVLDEATVGPMHDRYIIFTSRTSRWCFALGRGISAFVNEHTPLSVSLVSEIPVHWLGKE